MDIAVVVASIVVANLIGWWWIRRRRRLHRAWSAAARRLDGAPEPDGIALVGTLDDYGVRIAGYERSRFGLYTTVDTTSRTSARVSAPEAGGLKLAIVRREASSYRWGARVPPIPSLPGEAIATGDAAFDALFFVYGNDPTGVRSWLDADTRAEIVAAQATEVALADGVVTVARAELLDDANALLALAQAAVALARSGARIEAWWRERAHEARGRCLREDALRLELDDGRVPLRIEPYGALVDGGSATRLIAPVMGGAFEPFRIDAGEIEGAGGEGGLPQELVARIRALRPARIACDGSEIALDIAEVERDAARLEEAMAVATELATRRQRSYRS